MTLEELFQNPTALPTATKVVEELISSFEKANVSTEEIAKKVSADPVLSAKLLRLANSAYYNASRTISSVEDAVLMLGFATVRTLVISSGLVDSFKELKGIDLQQFWRYSLNTAVTAKFIAKSCKQSQDLAFVIGMMHAIGQLVIRAHMSEEALKLDEQTGPFAPRRMEAESEAWGFNYTDVGSELARRWKFPPVFSDTIASYPISSHDMMSVIVHLASWRAMVEENDLTPEQIADIYPTLVADALGLEENALMTQIPPMAELSAGLDELIK